MYILKCLKICWHKIIRKIKLQKNFDAFATNYSELQLYIYHAEELPEPPSEISAIFSTHLLT